MSAASPSGAPCQNCFWIPNWTPPPMPASRRLWPHPATSPDELQTILWNELFPLLQDNLRSVAGEWSGWPDEWLVQHVRGEEKRAVIPRLNAVVGVIREGATELKFAYPIHIDLLGAYAEEVVRIRSCTRLSHQR